MTAATTYSK